MTGMLSAARPGRQLRAPVAGVERPLRRCDERSRRSDEPAAPNPADPQS